MKDVLSILSSLKSKGLAIDMDDTGLNIRLNGPLSALTASDKAQLKDHKAAILDFIKAERKKKQQQAAGNIPRIADQPLYVLSNAQRRLWVLSQFEEGSVAYNIPGIHVFEGTLDNVALETAFNRLLQRHESLRTIFRQDEAGVVWQQVLPADATGFYVEHQDLQGVPETEQPLKALLQDFCIRPFDLATGPLIRVVVYRIAPQKWVCCYVLHHIVSDGWSMGILLQELLQYYAAHIAGEAFPLAPLAIQYRDYAAWQQGLLAGDALQAHKAYWLEQFSGSLPVLDLPLDFPRSAIKTYNGGLVTHTIAPDISQGLHQLCREQGATLFMGLLAVLNSLLHRYTQQEDIIIGTPIAGREQAELEDQIGLYLNTLALRTQFSGDDTFLQLLQQIRQVTLAAYDHQAYPFDELVEALPLQREMSRSALFDVMLILQNHAAGQAPDPAQTGGLQVSGYNGMEHLSSKFDLSFNFLETTNGTLQMAIEYNRDLFGESTIARIATCFTQLLTVAVHQPDTAVNRLPVLSEATIQQLLTSYNDTAADFPADRSIVSLFEEQVQATPDKTALIFENIQLTYRELNEQANRLARFLQTTYGVQPGMLVGIQCARSEWQVITVLGILKAGGAYVPVDMAYPAQRIAHIVADSQCKVLVNEEVLAAFKAVSHAYTPDNLQVDIAADQLAYVMYTSGSTGQPKGVMVEQRSVVRLVKGANYYRFTGDEIWLATSAAAFDVTTLEYWGALLHGGKLVLCTQDVLLDTTQLAAVLQEQQISIVWFTAGWLHQLIEEDLEMFRGLKTILAGGDKLSPDHINALHARYPELEIINGYGPTENTTFSLTYRITSALSDIPIGKPVSNSTVYILDPLQQLSLPGAIGEICVGGYGLSQGYLNNPALTAEKFVANPLVPGTLMYKTGDLGRWLPDGNIAFAGRKDDQVKIRGFRIEPGEIENTLLAYPPVEAAIVVVRTDAAGEKQLVAYVTGKEQLDITALRAALGQTLPAYMIPAYFMQLEQLPLTPNGKTDRHNLPDPVGTAVLSAVTYIAPRNATEQQLAAIWTEVLSRTDIGVKDNFFDLGGHSLKATRLAGRIYQAFEVKLALKELFINPVLEQQAALISKSLKTAYIAIPQAQEQTYYPLASAQQRLFFLQELTPDSLAYNMPMIHYLGHTIDRPRMRTALQRLVARHESFRTAFVYVEGALMQQVHPEVPVVLEEYSCVQADFEACMNAFIRPFALNTAPLLRAAIVHVKELGYVWIADLHHVISDGTSHQILMDDFLQLYQGIELPPLRLQYRDFALWQRDRLENGAQETQLAYWKSRLAGGIPKLNFPTDYARPAAFTYEGDTHVFTIPAALTAKIREFGRQQQGTLQMTLLAALNILLYKYTGQDDVLIGCPIANRHHADLDKIVGMFMNTLIMRTSIDGEQPFTDYYRQLVADSITAYEHQDVQFEELVDHLRVERDPSRNPVFDVVMMVQNFATGAIDGSALLGADTAALDKLAWGGLKVSKFDMSWLVAEWETEIEIHLVYYSAIFHPDTIRRLSGHFLQILEVVLAQPQIALSRINMVTAAEEQQLLTSFVQGAHLEYVHPCTLHELFEKKYQQQPDAIAVIDNGITLTYRQLNEQANQLARFLLEETGLQREDRVGVLMTRCKELIISFVGILKAGGVYVPMDRNSPEDRLHYVTLDAGLHTLLTIESLLPVSLRLQERSDILGHVVCMNKEVADITSTVPAGKKRYDLRHLRATDPGPLALQVSRDNLAYIIYTSGSTGQPKGVMIEHGAIVNLFEASMHLFHSENGGVVPLLASNVFDLSVYECIYPLISGGTAVMPDEDRMKDVAWIAEKVKEVNMLHAVPVLMQQVVNYIQAAGTHQDYLGVEYAFAGGEPVTEHLLRGVREVFPNVKTCGLYGPTESTLFITHNIHTYKDVYLSGGSSIGIPNPNTRIYIVDDHLQLLPVGVVGELCVGGPILARGYLNKPELTAEKFIPDPFVPGERIYKTGDLAKWLPDGSLVFLGRKDLQVKVRGYRIETGEIESHLLRHPDIWEAVVMAKPNKMGELELVAYIVGNSTLNTSLLRAYLGNVLPAYMVPDYYVLLPVLPLSPNGKVDRKRLPDPEGMSMETGVEYVAPKNETEEQLVSIWKEILGDKKIGVNDNFFDLGGNSLKIVRMVELMNKQFNKKIPVVVAFRFPNISALANHLFTDETVAVAALDEGIGAAVDVMDQTLHLLNHHTHEK
ncbi:non-ribosomal peptide synthetase [Chitinophaga nivalis]|uniref:Amino acid adenylation domain-containing protein n=1 Tax=Chitinophaga nivalis TaxID=2991709 RepID=A0ABT3IJ24_9BACT|nr:non-ribosomal peptide synthetase [Chitinophaga nivalis]MCW3466344.1 amino acid adenylation domain-containing protein [Chitinophaga nivalis]MCW3483965.1 amino acid adenylation domain-containing protein [Chitinophaga nivalis]